MAKDGQDKRGPGRPPGALNKATEAAKASKEAMRELLRRRVSETFLPLVDSQISNAQGIKYFVLRDKKTGKFTRIGHDAVKLLIEGDDPEATESIEVWEKDPSVQAFTDLMNRAIDKPVETVDMAVTGTLEIELVNRLAAGRKRIAQLKR